MKNGWGARVHEGQQGRRATTINKYKKGLIANPLL